MSYQRSGVPSLDEAIGGGFLAGDNVVWLGEHSGAADFFCHAFLATGRGKRRLVSFSERGPRFAVPRGVGILDLGSRAPADLAEAESLIADPRGAEGSRIVVDGLDDIALRWGAAAAEDFYRRVCPRLFDLGAIACWTGSRGVLSPATIKSLTKVAQCVFELRPGRLRVTKAEGRPGRLQGAVFGLDDLDGAPVVSHEYAVGRLGEGLRRVRRARNLTHRQIATLAGVTPAAISQVEAGRRGLSLDTLVLLCDGLGIGLDDLLGSQVAPGHQIARRDRLGDERPIVALFDDPAPGARVYLVRLAPDESGAPPFKHKGVELVLVAHGLALIELDESTPVVRAGDAVMVSSVPVQRWTNLAPEPTTLFWVAVG